MVNLLLNAKVVNSDHSIHDKHLLRISCGCCIEAKRGDEDGQDEKDATMADTEHFPYGACDDGRCENLVPTLVNYIRDADRIVTLNEATAIYLGFRMAEACLCDRHHRRLLTYFQFNVENSYGPVPVEELRERATKLTDHLKDIVDYANSQECVNWFADDLIVLFSKENAD